MHDPEFNSLWKQPVGQWGNLAVAWLTNPVNANPDKEDRNKNNQSENMIKEAK